VMLGFSFFDYRSSAGTVLQLHNSRITKIFLRLFEKAVNSLFV